MHNVIQRYLSLLVCSAVTRSREKAIKTVRGNKEDLKKEKKLTKRRFTTKMKTEPIGKRWQVNSKACLIYAHENGCRLGETTCQMAAFCGHLDCLRFAHENVCTVLERACE